MKKEKMHFRAVCRGFCAALCFVLLSSATTFSIRFAYVAGQPLLVGVEPFVANIFCAAMYPLVFNSFAKAFAYSDKYAIEEYLLREDDAVYFIKEIKNMFSSSEFAVQFISTLIIVALCAFAGLFPAIGGMFEKGMPLYGWFPFVIITPMCAISLILAKYEASRYFEKLKEEHDIDKMLNPTWLVLRVLLLMVCYPICAPMTPLAVYAVVSIISVFAKISAILTLIGALSAFVALIFVIRSIKILIGMRKRKKFLITLVKAIENKGYKLHGLKNPYKSFKSSKSPCSFTVKVDNKEYDCIVISTLWFKTPLIFTSPTDAYFLHKVGTDKHNFSIRNNIEFYHTGSGKKIIIVNPVPKHVFVTEDRKMKRVQCGDAIWGTSIHDAESFVGCMDRDCL